MDSQQANNDETPFPEEITEMFQRAFPGARTGDEVAFLSDCFLKVQGADDAWAWEAAVNLANYADTDIWEAALEWGYSGVMPGQPVVGGETPSSLIQMGVPASSVFFALMGLRADPSWTRQQLGEMLPPGGGGVDGDGSS